MSIAQGHAQAASPSRVISGLLSTLASDDPVAQALRESARRMIGVAVFSGVINILMLSGSLYMLQVYDRVIPSRNVATLLGLSLMVLLAYLVQGYFDALQRNPDVVVLHGEVMKVFSTRENAGRKPLAGRG